MKHVVPPGIITVTLASAVMLTGNVAADEISVTSSNALRPVLEEVAPAFEGTTGHKLVFTWGQAEILTGTSFDVALLTAAARPRCARRKAILSGRCGHAGAP